MVNRPSCFVAKILKVHYIEYAIFFFLPIGIRTKDEPSNKTQNVRYFIVVKRSGLEMKANTLSTNALKRTHALR